MPTSLLRALDQAVGRLHVAMNEPEPVSCVQALSHVSNGSELRLQAHLARGDVQGTAVDVAHRDVGPVGDETGLVDLAHVLVVHARLGTSFGEGEPTAAIRGGLLFGFAAILSGVAIWRVLLIGAGEDQRKDAEA